MWLLHKTKLFIKCTRRSARYDVNYLAHNCRKPVRKSINAVTLPRNGIFNTSMEFYVARKLFDILKYSQHARISR